MDYAGYLNVSGSNTIEDHIVAYGIPEEPRSKLVTRSTYTRISGKKRKLLVKEVYETVSRKNVVLCNVVPQSIQILIRRHRQAEALHLD